MQNLSKCTFSQNYPTFDFEIYEVIQNFVIDNNSQNYPDVPKNGIFQNYPTISQNYPIT